MFWRQHVTLRVTTFQVVPSHPVHNCIGPIILGKYNKLYRYKSVYKRYMYNMTSYIKQCLEILCCNVGASMQSGMYSGNSVPRPVYYSHRSLWPLSDQTVWVSTELDTFLNWCLQIYFREYLTFIVNCKQN